MPIARYAIITLTPALLILLGAVFGGYLPLLALLWLTLLAAGMDHVLPEPEAGGDALWAARLSQGLAGLHVVMIPVILLGLDNAALSPGAQLALFLAAASFMGQVSHPNAHDLIHRSDARSRNLGALVYTTMLYGHHVSAHRLVHHIHVGTPQDPATPLPGESFWAYVERAWPGNFRAGLAAEAERLERQNLPVWSHHNPYGRWIAGAVAILALATAMSGVIGLMVVLALMALVHLQILLSDYIQHYGLQRLIQADGSREPLAAHHSWNAPNGFSALLMMNAPRHSEHHMTAARPYQDLGEVTGPTLPHPMPIMAVIALIPGLWRDVMDRRALRVMEAAQKRLADAASETPADAQDSLVINLRRTLAS